MTAWRLIQIRINSNKAFGGGVQENEVNAA